MPALSFFGQGIVAKNAEGKRWYRYTSTPGDSRDGVGAPSPFLFQASSHRDAVAQIDERNALFAKLGGFLVNEALEYGQLLKPMLREKRVIGSAIYRKVLEFSPLGFIDLPGIRRKMHN